MIGSQDMLLSENIHPLQSAKGIPPQCRHHLSDRAASPTSRCPMKVIDTNMKMNSSLRMRSKEPWEKLSTFKGGKLVIVEGNIGVGKSTLTRRLADLLQYKVFLEPSTENPFLGKWLLLFLRQCNKKWVCFGIPTLFQRQCWLSCSNWEWPKLAHH